MSIADFLIKNKDLLQSITFLLVILTALISGVLFLYRKYKTYDDELKEKFSGEWTNEGCVDCELPTHFADLELEAKGKDIDGVLSVRNLQTDEEWNHLSVTGKRNLWTTTIQIVHFRNGRKMILGKFKLKLKGNNLQWRLLDGLDNFFPKETTIWKLGS